MIIKHLLLLDDEETVVKSLFDTVFNNNNKYYINKSTNILYSLDLIQSWNPLNVFDLSIYDFIFIDRDNSLNYKTATQEFHTFFLDSLSYTLEILNKNINIEWIIPISWWLENNKKIINEIIKQFEKKWIIDSREKRIEYENILLKNIRTKSLIPIEKTFIEFLL